MKILYPTVNASDEIIGKMTKKEAYKQGAMLRSVMIFIFDSSGRLLLQQRAKNKSRYPEYYCNSAAGHVEPNESYDEAAVRELKEELGISTKIKFIAKEVVPVGPNEFAMSSIYFGTSDDEISIQESEVKSCDFFEIQHIEQMIKNNYNFTPGFTYLFNKFVK